MKKAFLSILTPLMLLVSSCGAQGDKNQYHNTEGMIWHTTYHITYKGAPELADSVLGVLNQIDASLNVFEPNSLISRVNRQDSTLVDADFIRVYAASVRINRLTDGAFDPTLSPLITAWGFGKGHKATPDTARIDSILPYVGISKTRIYRDSLIKSDIRTQFNFSAIAKGYACDRVGDMFRRNGCRDYLVEIGGEIAARGKNPKGEDWRISIDRPILQDSILHDSQCIIQFTDMGVATSGNYRNFHTDKSGQNYGHTISSTTGRPVKTDVISATVLAPTAMEADALATSFMAMGSTRTQKLNRSLKLPVMLILTDSTVWTSPAFKKLMESRR